MNSLGLAVFCLVVAAASAGLHAGWGGSAVIAGPAGTVVRSGLSHGAVIAPGLHGLGLGLGGVVAPGIIAPGIIGAGHGLIGSGIEGQYIHDYTETLYDDGSYKPHVYGH